MQLITVRKLSKSVPRPLSLSGAGEDMSERPRRQPSAPSRRSPRRPLSFSFAVRLRLGLRRAASVHTLPAVRSASSLRLPLVDASEMSSSRRRTSAAPIPASWPARLCILSNAHPHVFRIRKRGTVSRPPHGCNSDYSNPATTVSSVEESNAFAASVTGR